MTGVRLPSVDTLLYPEHVYTLVSGRVQFREDDDVIAFVEDQGINPNDLARRLFEAEVRQMRSKERMRRLQDRGIELPRPSAEAVREDRER